MILPFLHAYQAVLYSSRAHSHSVSSALGRCVIADFAFGKSAWHFVQFSYFPVGNAAERLLKYCCFHFSSCPLASSHVRVASCTQRMHLKASILIDGDKRVVSEYLYIFFKSVPLTGRRCVFFIVSLVVVLVACFLASMAVSTFGSSLNKGFRDTLSVKEALQR